MRAAGADPSTPTKPDAARPVARLRLHGLDIAAETLDEVADRIVRHCGARDRKAMGRPLSMTSVNGHVLSLCGRRPAVLRLFQAADLIHCDGQPLVMLSRRIGGCPLPERVATTDLFPRVAERAARQGLRFYLLGGTPETSERLCAILAAAYPGLVAGASHGYLSGPEEARVVAKIAALQPDVLWVAMGVPREQAFVARHIEALGGVGVVKTAGGLFDFLTGRVRRAPAWMQRFGLEWLFRLMQEPRRLFWRYAVSNPHALVLMVTGLRRVRPEP